MHEEGMLKFYRGREGEGGHSNSALGQECVVSYFIAWKVINVREVTTH